MVENTSYDMAIDLLCCHLGISEDEARFQLGLTDDRKVQQHISETQEALMGITE